MKSRFPCTFLAVTWCTALAGLCFAAPQTKRGADSAARQYAAAAGLLNRGLYEQAAAEYQKFLAADPQHENAALAHYGLAVCHYRLGKFQPAIDELAIIAKDDSFQFAAEVACMLGRCSLALKQFAPAAKSFDRVVENWPDHALADDAAAGGVEALHGAGQFDEALKHADQFASKWKNNPLSARVNTVAALSDMELGHDLAAARRFAAVAESSSDAVLTARAEFLAGQCFLKAARDEEARRFLALAVDRTNGPFADEAALALAGLQERGGDSAGASATIDGLISKNKASPVAGKAHLLRARLWLNAKEIDKARAALTTAAAADSSLKPTVEYYLAKCDLQKGDASAAATRLTAATKQFADSDMLPDMLFDLAVARLRTGDDRGALKALTRLESKLERLGDDTAAGVLQMQAAITHRLGQYDKSQGYCDSFAKRFANNPSAGVVAFISAENAFLTGDNESAFERFAAFLKQHPKDAQGSKARLRAGWAAYRLQKFDDARAMLDPIAEAAMRDADLRSALLALGEIAFAAQNWKDAEQHLSRYVTGDGEIPSADGALLKLGISRQRLASYAKAIEAFDSLIRNHPKSVHRLQAQFERGQSLMETKNTTDATTAFEAVLAEDAESRFAPYALNHLATIAMTGGHPDQAAERFEKLLTAKPPAEIEATALLNLGSARIAQQNFESAEKAFKRFLSGNEDSPRAAEALAGLAIAIARQDRCDEAIKVFDQLGDSPSARIDPALRRSAAYERAWCLKSTGKQEEAAKLLRVMIDDPKAGELSDRAALELADIHFAAKRFQDAASLLHPALERATGDQSSRDQKIAAQIRFRLGICEFELGHFDVALQLLDVFLADSPTKNLTASALYYAGEAAFRLGKFESASKHFALVTTDHSKDSTCASSLLRLGESLAQLQRWMASEEAFAAYLKRFAEENAWFQAQFGLAWAQENQGRFADAIASYSKLVDKHKGPTAARAQFQIGECHFAQKHYDEALKELLKVDILYDYPEWSAAALYEAGRCFEQLGKTVEARNQYQQVVDKHKKGRWFELASQRLAQVAKLAAPPR
jgi:TolA-binding protein